MATLGQRVTRLERTVATLEGTMATLDERIAALQAVDLNHETRIVALEQLVLPPPLPPAGQAIIMSTTGNDANPGTEIAPVATVGRLAELMRAGVRTGLIRGGVYPQSMEDMDWPVGTSWADPVLISAYPGEPVTFRPDMSASRVLHVSFPKEFIEFRGFECDAINAAGPLGGHECIKLAGCRAIRLRQIVALDPLSQGISAQASDVLGSGFHEFLDCRSYRAGIRNPAPDNEKHGFYIAVPDCLVSGGESIGHLDWGLQLFNGDQSRCLVERMLLQDNGAGGLVVDAADDAVIRKMLILGGTSGRNIHPDGTSGRAGVLVGSGNLVRRVMIDLVVVLQSGTGINLQPFHSENARVTNSRITQGLYPSPWDGPINNAGVGTTFGGNSVDKAMNASYTDGDPTAIVDPSPAYTDPRGL